MRCSADTMHTQWQVPGQTLGPESGLISSVKVSWRQGPSCRHRGWLLHNSVYCELLLTREKIWENSNDANKLVSLRDYFLCCIFGLEKLREGESHSFHHRKVMSLVLDTHRNIKRDMLTLLHLTLCGTSSDLWEKVDLYSVSLQKLYKWLNKDLTDILTRRSEVKLPLYSWPELVWFPGPGASLSQHHCLGINYLACRDTAPVYTRTYTHGKS